MTADEEIAEIRRVALAEGDVVVVRCRDPISKEVAERIRQTVSASFAEVGCHPPVMVLDRNVEIEIITAERLRRTPLIKLAEGLDDPGPPPDFLHPRP